MATTTTVNLTCDGWCENANPIAMIDQDGFAYCEPCGMRRRDHQPCRKLRPYELRKLQRGQQLARY